MALITSFLDRVEDDDQRTGDEALLRAVEAVGAVVPALAPRAGLTR